MRLFSKNYKGTEEWKRVRTEKLLKIKNRIERILEKEYSITAKEKSRRDRFFRRLSRICRAIGIRANHVTLFGIFLVCVQIYLFASGYEFRGLAVAILAACTDMIDGPIARFRYTEYDSDDVTAFGTFLDHFRDYILAFTFGYFAFFYHNRIAAIETTLFAIVVAIYAGIFIGTIIKLRKYRLPNHSAEKRLHGFLLPEMQTSFWGRVQFALIIVGTVVLFVGRMNDWLYFIHLSYAIIGMHIGVNIRNLLEEYIMS